MPGIRKNSLWINIDNQVTFVVTKVSQAYSGCAPIITATSGGRTIIVNEAVFRKKYYQVPEPLEETDE